MTTRTGYHRRATFDALTPRQREVLALLARGKTNGEIATELGISFDTAKTHVSEILGKLGVDSREEAAAAWRAEQSPVSRVRRFAPGWLLGVRGVTVAVGALAAVALLAAGTAYLISHSDEDTPATPETPPVSATAISTTPAASPAATATAGSETPAPGSPTPDPNETIAGLPVFELTTTDPVDLPVDAVLLFNHSCYACDGGWNMKRAYRDASGELHVESVMPDEQLAVEPRPQVVSFVSYGAGTMYVALCDGYCGGLGEPTPGSTMAIWRSGDGGVTWSELASGFGVDTYLALARQDEVLVNQVTREGTTATVAYAWYPGGRSQAAPESGFFHPTRTSSGRLLFVQTDGPVAPLRDLSAVDEAGSASTISGPNDDRLDWWAWSDLTDQKIFWHGTFEPGSPEYIALTDRTSGATEAIFYAGGADFRVTGQLADGRYIGGYSPPGSGISFVPLVIDLQAATISPIRGLMTGESGLRNAIPYAVANGTPRRVATGDGDCLNVRETASTSSASLGCYAEGVLLMATGEARDGWLAVTAPQGERGWVSAEFVK